MKMKKVMAVVLATTMVMGGVVTAFADEDTKSGSTTGAGSTEGHVEQKTVNVVLPTVPVDSSPFAYTIDPERLIQGTDAGKYAEGSVFPAADKDTGVYFLVGDKKYANESNALQVINKSSCAVKLTVDVEAKATAGGKDIDLATSKTLGTDKAELYLGLKVGSEEKVVSATKQSVNKVIAGTPDNFETTVKDGAYVYQEKADATTWKAMNFNMEGSVNQKNITTDTTAPSVEVTWKWAEATEDEAATPATDAVDYTAPAEAVPSIATTSYNIEKGKDVVVTVNLGAGEKAAKGIKSIGFTSSSGNAKTLEKTNYTLENSTLTFKSSYTDTVTSTRDYTITFDDAESTKATITLKVN